VPECKYNWPDAADRHVIGTRVSRLDGPAKASGRAEYTYDVHPEGMLFAKVLRCPHAHARITALDLTAARNMPGVKAARVIQAVGTEIQWQGDEVAAVAATTEEQAEDAVRAIKVEYEVLPHFVMDEDLAAAGAHAKPPSTETTGDPDKAFAAPGTVVSEGYYGMPVIVHCCLETHGSTAQWNGDHLQVWASTQNVSGIGGDFAESLNIPGNNVRTICQYIGGGFGSKFGPDRWGIEGARLAKDAGAPVRLMLERDSELLVAGARPSIWGKVRVAASPDGKITGWDSETWATGGMSGGGRMPIPYVWKIPNNRWKHTSIAANIGGARAWRAPTHPQAALVTNCALDDLAAKLNLDPIEFFTRNADLLGDRAGVYKEELAKAAELSQWSSLWHRRGQAGGGTVKRGLGVSLHTWGGRGHNSNCAVTIRPDGGVELALGTQDLGTGTRTAIVMVAAETFGLPIEAITLHIGDSIYPPSGPSGGSTTIGGVSTSTRRGCVDAVNELFAAVAPALGTTPDRLEAVGGSIRVRGDSSKAMSWKQACSKLGVKTIHFTGKNPGPCALNSSGVGGVQVADVSVDTETGIVRVNRMTAVQDCGLIIDLKTAESQVYGALIMGISYALYEEKVMDPTTGRMLNPNMEFYKLAGLGDIGEMVVHMMTGPGYDERGPVGLGEPPVISPGAAISNAVANALGVRVPTLPLSPDRVLAALHQA
jgi:xanthine dehydrogenase YagR molybdenum-binding subunit